MTLWMTHRLATKQRANGSNARPTIFSTTTKTVQFNRRPDFAVIVRLSIIHATPAGSRLPPGYFELSKVAARAYDFAFL
jgi:hypothetical protein